MFMTWVTVGQAKWAKYSSRLKWKPPRSYSRYPNSLGSEARTVTVSVAVISRLLSRQTDSGPTLDGVVPLDRLQEDGAGRARMELVRRMGRQQRHVPAPGD